MLDKIKTKEEIEKKRKKNHIFIGTIMILLLVVSTAGYSLMGNSGTNQGASSVKQNGFEFFYEDGLWKTEINGGIFNFQFLPEEVLDVPVTGFYDLNNYINQPLYFVGTNQGNAEVLINLQKYVSRYQGACIDSSDCEGNLPLKDCSNNLIIFEDGNETLVQQNGLCVYLTGDPIKSADAFLYKLLGVN